MFANLQKILCCSNTLPSDYQIKENGTNSEKTLVLPLSQIQAETRAELESKKEIIYYSSLSSDVYSIELSDIIESSTAKIKKVVFGTNHCLILLTDTSNPNKTYLAGFGSNTNGQLGLDVYSKNKSDEDLHSKNYYDKVFQITVLNENVKIIDIAASNNFSLLLVYDTIKKQQSLLRFELTQEEVFALGSGDTPSITPVKSEECPQDILNHLTHIYAKNGRVILQYDSKDTTLYAKGIMFNMDIFETYKVFQQCPYKKISQLSLGLNHCLILFTDNTLISFGHNEYGELGVEGDNPKKIYNINFFEDRKIKKISTGSRHNLILCEDGSLFSFGDNSSNQCMGDKKYYPSPKLMKIKDIVDIECGGKISLCKNKKGEVFAWGECDYLFKDEIFNSSSLNKEENFRLMNDIKLKSIAGLFAGDDVSLFYTEQFTK